MATCQKCGKPVSADEVGLNKKIVNRAVEKFLCIGCLAEHFKTTEEDLHTLIEHFRAAGCSFFSPKLDDRS